MLGASLKQIWGLGPRAEGAFFIVFSFVLLDFRETQKHRLLKYMTDLNIHEPAVTERNLEVTTCSPSYSNTGRTCSAITCMPPAAGCSPLSVPTPIWKDPPPQGLSISPWFKLFLLVILQAPIESLGLAEHPWVPAPWFGPQQAQSPVSGTSAMGGVLRPLGTSPGQGKTRPPHAGQAAVCSNRDQALLPRAPGHSRCCHSLGPALSPHFLPPHLYRNAFLAGSPALAVGGSDGCI